MNVATYPFGIYAYDKIVLVAILLLAEQQNAKLSQDSQGWVEIFFIQGQCTLQMVLVRLLIASKVFSSIKRSGKSYYF